MVDAEEDVVTGGAPSVLRGEMWAEYIAVHCIAASCICSGGCTPRGHWRRARRVWYASCIPHANVPGLPHHAQIRLRQDSLIHCGDSVLPLLP